MTLKRLSLVILTAAIIAGFVSTARVRAETGAKQSDPQNEAARRALFLRGAELWPIYCNTCHNARPGTEFSPAEWDTIMMHMRTQANLPAKDAQAILEYLKASR